MEDIVCILGGWAPQSVSDRYGTGPRMCELAGLVERLNYRDLDLSHLENYPGAGPAGPLASAIAAAGSH